MADLTDSGYLALTKVVDTLNHLLNMLTINSKFYNNLIILALSLLLGYYLKAKLKSDRYGLWYWVIFSILIFCTFKYIGLGS